MADMLHGVATFPGVTGFQSGDYTVSHGISPGLVSIRFIPRDPDQVIADIPLLGDVKITDGQREFLIPECVVNSLAKTKEEGYVWTLSLYDRRWRWQFGSIDGRYNERDAVGKIRKETRLGVHEIAVRLLKEMGEIGFVLGDLPDPADDDLLPSINWEAEVPAKALADLCDQFNVRVIYQPIADRVILAFPGNGEQLPARSFTERKPTAVKPIRPQGLKFVGGPITLKAALLLKPVGEELDGSVVPIDELSYKPVAGWSRTGPPDFTGVVLPAKYAAKGLKMVDVLAAAKKSVYRWYRVSADDFTGDGFEIPGLSNLMPDLEITEDWQIIPLDTVYDVQRDENKNLYSDPPKVYGEHYGWTSYPFKNSTTGAQVQSKFTIDTPRGLVMFERYVYKINTTTEVVTGWLKKAIVPKERGPADIILVTSVNVRDPITKQVVRYSDTQEFINTELASPLRVIRREDVIYVHSVTYFPTDWSYIDPRDNLAEMVAATETTLGQYVEEYDLKKPEEYTYPRIEYIDPDGAISQVTWSVSGACSTKASRNDEHVSWIPPFKFRRGQERALNQTEQNRTAFGKALKIFGGIAG